MAKGRWFRKYENAMDDPKVQLLSDWHYRAWDTLLCFASKNGGEFPGDLPTLCFVLRKPEGKVRDTMQVLLSSGLIEQSDEGYIPHKWNEYQYKSDVSTDRVQTFRKRRGNVSSDVSETPPDYRLQTTETETERKKISRARRAPTRVCHPRFDDFWDKCPKRKGKGAAEKAFTRASKETDPEILITGITRYAASQAGKDADFIAHPATWLNQKRWLDEDSSAPSTGATIHVLSREVQEQETENLKRLGVI